MELTVESLQFAIDTKTKPLGSLGRLESLAIEIALAVNSLKPRLAKCELQLFAGDHGIAVEGVSAYPQEVTRQMVLNFLSGGAASTVIARQLSIAVKIVNCGIVGEPVINSLLLDMQVAQGTNNFLYEPAMSAAQLQHAIGNGGVLGKAPSADAVAMGEMGIGNSSSATLIASKVMGLPVTNLVGRGTGLTNDALRRKGEILTEASRRTSLVLAPMDALREYGGFEIATMYGSMLGVAQSNKLVIVDGYISTAAALCVLKLNPGLRRHFIFAHQSAERGHAAMLAHLNAEPVLNLGMRLGEGTGALVAWPILQSAAAVLSDMASFADAGVSGPVESP